MPHLCSNSGDGSVYVLNTLCHSHLYLITMSTVPSGSSTTRASLQSAKEDRNRVSWSGTPVPIMGEYQLNYMLVYLHGKKYKGHGISVSR